MWETRRASFEAGLSDQVLAGSLPFALAGLVKAHCSQMALGQSRMSRQVVRPRMGLQPQDCLRAAMVIVTVWVRPMSSPARDRPPMIRPPAIPDRWQPARQNLLAATGPGLAQADLRSPGIPARLDRVQAERRQSCPATDFAAPAGQVNRWERGF